MTKYTNPFHTMKEAMALLISYGTNPYQSGATFSADDSVRKPNWAENIIGISIDKKYETGSHYYAISIHLNEAGFQEVVALIDQTVYDVAEVHSRVFNNVFIELSIEPSPLLRLFALVPKSTVGES